MKKIAGVLALFLIMAGCKKAEAFELPDFIETTLIDHVSAVTQAELIPEEGEDARFKGALTDSIVRIGKHNGHSILDAQIGWTGELEESGFGNFIAGGFFKVSTFTTDYLELPDHWKFLNAIEHGLIYQYDFTDKDDFFGYQVGLPFTLNPSE